ncbi:low choriolytic enzyme [Gadus morhua]|uniref:low choriolytic enzyme n=1 Tax=Gadus morhua TaxID=8049 RepID=UPI0011B525BE|nr:low choriolytic enzyme-like [Gadus morhua]XP_030233640.1 low choriolytic enzyme-like [Gadus morhua]
MTSFATLILVLSLTSSAFFSHASGERNSTTGEDDDNELDSSERETEAPQGASDLIEAANTGLERLRTGPQIKFGDIAQTSTSTRNASPCTARGCTWPRSYRGYVYVPIYISPKYSRAERNVIIRSLVEFHRVSCIRFVWRRRHRDYLYFYPFTGCWSYIGRQRGLQVISLQQRGCVSRGTVQHEILHALGFHHEQSRSDRDKHVRIQANNVLPGKLSNFNKVNTNNLGTPYDYSSIMHYSRFAFSKQRGVLPTIVPIPDSKAVIGQSTKMSGNDIKRLNKLYKCRGY